MKDEILDQPITKRYLNEFTKEILIPEISTIFDEKLTAVKNEILNSNDKLAKTLNNINVASKGDFDFSKNNPSPGSRTSRRPYGSNNISNLEVSLPGSLLNPS